MPEKIGTRVNMVPLGDHWAPPELYSIFFTVHTLSTNGITSKDVGNSLRILASYLIPLVVLLLCLLSFLYVSFL